MAEHGSDARYRKHKRDGEAACAACLKAHQEKVHERRMAAERKVR